MKVLLFGMLADVVKQTSLEFENVSDTDSLLNKVKQLHPTFHDYKFVIALNKKIINTNQKLVDQDEVALLPPFAGG